MEAEYQVIFNHDSEYIHVYPKLHVGIHVLLELQSHRQTVCQYIYSWALKRNIHGRLLISRKSVFGYYASGVAI